MLYCSWDMVHDRCNYFSFWAIFYIFTPLTSPKNQNLKKKKKKNTRRYHHFRQVHQKSWSYDILFLRYDAWQMYLLFFISRYFLPFYPPNNPKVLKKWKKMPGDIIILHMCTKNYDQMMYSSCDMVSDRQTDEQMDRHTEKVTYRGAPT